jgi:hypothetical protein
MAVQRLRDLLWRFHEDVEWKGAGSEQTRHAHIAVHRAGLGVHNHEEVYIAIRRGGTIHIGPKQEDLVGL